MTELLPPKGKVSISDLRKMYNLMSKCGIVSQLDDVVYRIWEDMVFSLQTIKEWCSQDSVEDDAGSIDKHLTELFASGDVDGMIVAIDNCLNNYHGISVMIEYIIDADFEEANKFLDEIRDNKE